MKKFIALILCALLMLSAVVPGAFAYGEEPDAPAVEVTVQEEAGSAEPEDEPVPAAEEPEADAEMPAEEPVPLAGEDPASDEPGEPGEVTLVADSVSVKGVLPEGAELVAEEIADPFAPKETKRAASKSRSAAQETAGAWEAAAYYDIKLLSGSEALRPEGAVTVTIENVPFKHDGSIVSVRHFLDDEAAIAAGIADGSAEALYGEQYAEALPAAAEAAEAVMGEKGVVYVETITEADGLTVNGTTVSFPAKSFSIYAVGEELPILTVKFQYGTTVLETLYVKAADTAEDLETIIYDYDLGDISPLVFRGWTRDSDYTLSSDILSIDEVRTDAKAEASAMTADKEIVYYAAVFKQFKVTYVDAGGITIGTGVAEAPVRDTEATYTVNQGYTTDDSHNFEGWFVENGAQNITDTGLTGVSPADIVTLSGENPTLFPNSTEMKLTGDVKFSVSAPEGHWLVFNENGKGATYNAPRFIKAGETTQQAYDDLLPMVRNGYSFVGWFYGTERPDPNDPESTIVDYGVSFTPGGYLTETTTIYAKWEAVATANYVILIWKQNIAGNGYDFVESIQKTGNVNSTPNAVANNGTVSGVTIDTTGFHFARTDQAQQTISPTGGTVVNVYWDRNQYTLTFQVWRSFLIIFGSWNTVKTITALYQQPIGQYFPIVGDDGTSYSASRWAPQDSYTFDQVLVYIDVMPAENITFHKSESSYSVKTIHYMVETLPGEEGGTSYNGKNFTEYKYADAEYRYFTEAEDYINLVGFSKSADFPPEAYNSNGVKLGSVWENEDARHVYCYYLRDFYNINFMDGVYVDGNNNPLSEDSQGAIHVKDHIAYGSDVSEYASYVPDEEHYPDRYVFEGWFVDKACTTAYTFNKMTEDGITVYAKWRLIQYRVFLHPNVPQSDTSLDWGSEDQEMNFRVSIGGKVSVPSGTRTGYEFYGWYTDPDFNNVFAPDTVLNESTVTADYDKTVDMTDPMNKWGVVGANPSNSDVGRFWINKKYDLYARWSAILVGAEGIGVFYDANGGDNAPSDLDLHKDNSFANAGAEPTAPNGKVFSHWVLQHWNGTTYVDTTITLLPGDVFSVLKSDAKITDATTNAVVSPDDVVGGVNYRYTVQLRAEYKDAEDITLTHIYWYDNFSDANDGNGALYRSDEVKINEPVSIYGIGTGESIPVRPGYIFKGWTKNKGGSSADFLVWTGSNYTANGEAVTTVIGDEVNASGNVLYAVWEETTITITYQVVGPANAENFGTVVINKEGEVPETTVTEEVLAKTGTASGAIASAADAFAFAGWYLDEACETPVGETYMNVAFVPSKGSDGLYSAVTYYAKFEYNTTTLTITNNSGHDAIFTVNGKGYTGLLLAIPAGKSLTIANVYVGETYTIKMDTGWSWRYEGYTVTTEGLAPGGNTHTVPIQQMAKTKWLSGTSYAWKYDPKLYGESD